MRVMSHAFVFAVAVLVRAAAIVLAIGCGRSAAPSMRSAAPTPRDALLVLAKRDRTLAVVDPASLEVVARVPVEDDPHEVVATEDGRSAYVTSYGRGKLHALAVVDLVAQAPLPPVELGPLLGPHGLAMKGGKVWFTAEGAKAVGSFDPKRNAVDRVLGTGQDRTHMIFVSDDLRRIVTTNVTSGTLSIFDLRAAWEQAVVPVGRGAEGFDVTPDGKEIWVASAEPGTLSIVDAERKTVAQTIEARIVGANRLKITPDGTLVLVSSLQGGGVVVYDAKARTLRKRVEVCRSTSGILIEPSGERAFVACPADDEVVVIDLRALEARGRFAAGHEPDGMAWASRR
jgi:DNA-binding beta-propeller fold protein YncE